MKPPHLWPSADVEAPPRPKFGRPPARWRGCAARRCVLYSREGRRRKQMQHQRTTKFIAGASPRAEATLTGTVRRLWPYIWPGDRADLKLRVLFAVLCMVAAKLATIAVPYAYKWATDALTGERGHDDIPLPAVLTGVVAL